MVYSIATWLTIPSTSNQRGPFLGPSFFSKKRMGHPMSLQQRWKISSKDLGYLTPFSGHWANKSR